VITIHQCHTKRTDIVVWQYPHDAGNYGAHRNVFAAKISQNALAAAALFRTPLGELINN